MLRSRRGLSSVVGVLVLVGLVVTLATGVFAAGMAMDVGSRPPSVTVEGADVLAACVGCGPDQVVRLRHAGGDVVSLSDVAIVVGAGEGARGRLVDLPLATNCLTDDHVAGRDLFDGRCGRVAGPVTAVGDDADGEWAAGETVRVRLKKSAVRLAPGDTVTVRLVHTPSGTTVTERTLPVVGRRSGGTGE